MIAYYCQSDLNNKVYCNRCPTPTVQQWRYICSSKNDTFCKYNFCHLVVQILRMKETMPCNDLFYSQKSIASRFIHNISRSISTERYSTNTFQMVSLFQTRYAVISFFFQTHQKSMSTARISAAPVFSNCLQVTIIKKMKSFESLFQIRIIPP